MINRGLTFIIALNGEADDIPAFYDLLRHYYRQDPLQRLTKAASADSTAAS